MTDVVIWVGRAGAGAAGVEDLDDGPMVDALELCVGMSDRVIVERMGGMLDMPSECLSVHREAGLLALGVGLRAI
ncbi:hypothetical protein IGS75_08980 [Gluconobacter sphaericus]|uniref:hypothetical protein n=1 Tax=Gluconobacter sphaericus TaxID=574987 RepID=UPI00192496ED|nr:hypothetical protein [Gluconobacter sphaericus]QQX90332.1 hypothetical protein IGS75_08980 [Gluconobacter sphaericus]